LNLEKARLFGPIPCLVPRNFGVEGQLVAFALIAAGKSDHCPIELRSFLIGWPRSGWRFAFAIGENVRHVAISSKDDQPVRIIAEMLAFNFIFGFFSTHDTSRQVPTIESTACAALNTALIAIGRTAIAILKLAFN
jgi:hypothetical protein